EDGENIRRSEERSCCWQDCSAEIIQPISTARRITAEVAAQLRHSSRGEHVLCARGQGLCALMSRVQGIQREEIVTSCCRARCCVIVAAGDHQTVIDPLIEPEAERIVACGIGVAGRSFGEAVRARAACGQRESVKERTDVSRCCPTRGQRWHVCQRNCGLTQTQPLVCSEEEETISSHWPAERRAEEILPVARLRKAAAVSEPVARIERIVREVFKG